MWYEIRNVLQQFFFATLPAMPWYGQLIVVHLIISVLVLLLITTRILKVHKYMFFVVLLLPGWGLLLVLLLHIKICFRAQAHKDIDVEKLKLESELYRSITIDEKKVAASTVPIEEALVINSARERRSIIMDVLNDNPKEYISFLQKAGNNEDTEVVHYAVTAMVEIAKENDYLLQRFEREYAAHPEDRELLQQYTDFLWNCLSQNLMQGQVEALNRELFSNLIQKKIAAEGALADYIRAVENDLRRGNYALADENLREMRNRYPKNEESYLLRLQYLASLGRGEELQQLLQVIEDLHMFLSAQAREVLAFWKK